MKQIFNFYELNKNNLKSVHLNTNSVNYTFSPLVDVLSRSMVDILSLKETKLVDSFTCANLSVSGYRLHRKKGLQIKLWRPDYADFGMTFDSRSEKTRHNRS